VPQKSSRRTRGLDADDREFESFERMSAVRMDEDYSDNSDGLPEGDRWSTWDQSEPLERGPQPWPDWLITDLGAVDTELGVLKTGKEADVFLLRRGLPQDGPSCLLAAKRYRSSEHRMFHRDAGYLEGRSVLDSRVNRAMANRTAFGRRAIAGQWAAAEFQTLRELWTAGLPVPYPVQIVGTEILMEFLGEPDGVAAPRLAQLRSEDADLTDLFGQAAEAMVRLARGRLAHGDLSPYNLMVHRHRLMIIDLPQVVDVIANPHGARFLARDATNVSRWFAGRGVTDPLCSPAALTDLLLAEAGLRG